MNNIFNTINLILKYSVYGFIITLIYALAINALLIFSSHNSSLNLAPLIIQLVTYAFIGILIGNSIHRLKLIYLYDHLTHYRNTIILSSILLTGILSLPSALILLYLKYNLLTSLFFGFCTGTTVAQIFFNKYKLLVISTMLLPTFIIYTDNSTLLNSAMIGYIFFTAVQIFTSLKLKSPSHNIRKKQQSFEENRPDLQLSHLHNMLFLRVLRIYPLSRLNLIKQGKIITATYLPISRFSILIILPITILLSLIQLLTNDFFGFGIFIFLPIFYLIMINLRSYYLAGENLINLTSISHLFAKNRHMQLKQNFINNLDKKIVIDVFYALFCFEVIFFISGLPNLHHKTLLTVLAFTSSLLAFSPLIIRNSTGYFMKVMSTLIFPAILISGLFWSANHSYADLLSIEVTFYVGILIGLRLYGMHWLKNCSIELLMKRA